MTTLFFTVRTTVCPATGDSWFTNHIFAIRIWISRHVFVVLKHVVWFTLEMFQVPAQVVGRITSKRCCRNPRVEFSSETPHWHIVRIFVPRHLSVRLERHKSRYLQSHCHHLKGTKASSHRDAIPRPQHPRQKDVGPSLDPFSRGLSESSEKSFTNSNPT
jgi:hypothetical protein